MGTTVKARPKVNIGNGVKGKSSRKVKVPTLKETSGNSGNVAATSGAVCSSSGEIPAPVANYFAFLFSHWAGMRQEHPNRSPKDIQDMLWKQWSLTSGAVPPSLQGIGRGEALEQEEGG